MITETEREELERLRYWQRDAMALLKQWDMVKDALIAEAPESERPTLGESFPAWCYYYITENRKARP